MNTTVLADEKSELGTLEWDESTYTRMRYAPSYTQRPYPRPHCCARCRRGEVGHNMPCGYAYRCPNPACDHGARS